MLYVRSSCGIWRSSPAALLASLDAIVLIYLAWKEDLAAGESSLDVCLPEEGASIAKSALAVG